MQLLNDCDNLQIWCQDCIKFHTFIISTPMTNRILKNEQKTQNILQQNFQLKNNKLSHQIILQVKNQILRFGIGRYSDYQLDFALKPEQIQYLANQFLICLIEKIQNRKISKNLSKLVDIPEITKINQYDWEIHFNEIFYAKTLLTMYKINCLIQQFKLNPLNYDESEDLFLWDNLLCFLDNNVITHNSYGQQTFIDGWTKNDDINLLRGVHQHGFGQYHLIEFSKMHSPPLHQELTQRIKYLLSQIRQSHEYQFYKCENINSSESDTGENLTINQKNKIFQYFFNNGIKTDQNGCENWSLVIQEINDSYIDNEDQIEDIYNYFKRLCQEIIYIQDHSIKIDQTYLTDKMQTQELKFIIDYDISVSFLNKMYTIQSIREKILPKWDLIILEEEFKKNYQKNANEILSQFQTINQQGWENISEENFQQINSTVISIEVIVNGIKITQKSESKKNNSKQEVNTKRKYEELDWSESEEDKRKKTSKKIKNNIVCDPKLLKKLDEVQLPLVVNNTLTILELGKINYKNPKFHSAHNIFPVGFKSIRIHQSQFKRDKKVKYECEIIEKNDQILFQVISEEEPNNILKETTASCVWVKICKKIDSIQLHQRKNVTVSGTEKFGVTDLPVRHLIEQMENADKCSKYIFQTIQKNNQE